jgi:hypothetical protein
MKLATVALALLILVACGSAEIRPATSATQPSASGARTNSPSAPATPSSPTSLSPLLVALVAGGQGQSNLLELLNSDGQPVAKTSSKPAFRGNFAAPWVSVSASRVYYMDGPSDIRWLMPDGSTGLATSVAVKAMQQVSFAVSSDDKRLAVSVLSYALPPSSCTQCPSSPPRFLDMQLSVGDLVGGNQTTIFSSAQVAEVPVGWHQGHLVVGVVPPICCQSLLPNPFSVGEYHVVDPASGNRISTICAPPLYSLGLPEPAGSLCGSGGPNSSLSLESWDGHSAGAGSTPSDFDGSGALSPTGQIVALGGNGITVQDMSGQRLELLPLGLNSYVLGWLDSGHLAVLEGGNSSQAVLIDLRKAM